ncbi:MAG: hypothetical protein V3T86_07635 [Planctomycetota bacterium]
MLKLLVRVAAVFLFGTSTVFADIVLADLFQELAVLQRGMKVPIWGRADPGEAVTVSFEGQSVSTKADKDGRWRVELGPFDAMAARPLTVTGKNTIRLERVFVGEVWVCSGQSNMAWPLQRTDGAKQELAELANPRLFFYSVKHRVSGDPVSDAGGKWVRASAETATNFSAVAYYFGKELRATLAARGSIARAESKTAT